MKKYYSLLLLALLFTLQGCVLLAAGAGAATTAVVVNDRRSFQTMADDRNIEFTANSQISHDANLNTNSHVVVVSFDHAVLIAGQVPSQDVRQRIQALIQALPKVSRIYNELEIRPPTSPFIRSQDAWITAKVKTEMMRVKGLNFVQIKVVTENSTVFLMGIVTRKQDEIATIVARQIEGVNRVVKLFEYTHGV